MDSDGQFTRNGIPWIFVHLPDRGISERHLSHLIIGACRPQYFNLFTLAVRHNLTADIRLVGFVEHIDAKINNEVGEINLFIRCEAKLLNTESLSASEAGCSSHQFFNVC